MSFDIRMSRSREHLYTKEWLSYFKEGLFCDAQFVCPDGTAIKCHRLVLAGLSSHLADAMELTDREDQLVTLVSHDVDSKALWHFLERVYTCLSAEEGAEMNGEDDEGRLQEVAALLEADVHDRKVKKKASIPITKVEEVTYSVKEEEPSDAEEDEEEDDEVDDEPWDEDDDSDYRPLDDYEPKHRVKKEVKQEYTGRKRGRKRKLKGEDSEPYATKRPRKRRSQSTETKPRMSLKDKLGGEVSEEELAKVEHDLKQLENMMCNGQGEIMPKVVPYADDDVRLVEQSGCLFAAILGVCRSVATGQVSALPLAWSPGEPLDGDDRYRQYATVCQALKVVYGLSDVEVQHHVVVRKGVNLKNLAKYSYRRDFRTYSTEMLEGVFDRQDVRKAHEKGEAKVPIVLSEAEEAGLIVSIKSDLSLDDLQGVLLLMKDTRGGLTAMRVSFGNDEDRKADVAPLMDALFTLWTLRADQPEITKYDKIHKDYVAVHPLAEMALVAREYLDNPDKLLKSDELASSEKQCPDCGVMFPLQTALERGRYEAHKTNHFFEKFECDCEVSWKTKSGKKFHVMHVHMEGFVKCPHCVYVCRPSGLSTHMRSQHEEMTCEHCAATVKGQYRLGQHMVSYHPEHTENKRIAGSGTCEVCGEFYVGLSKHIRSAHKPRETCSCDICGKQFLRKTNLKSHRLRIHFPEEMAFQCDVCSNRFEDREHLRKHMHNVHIKSRHLVCRYEGCTMAYDDSGSRSNHERIKHGHPYPRAAKMGLVPPIVRKKSPFLLPIPTVPPSATAND